MAPLPSTRALRTTRDVLRLLSHLALAIALISVVAPMKNRGGASATVLIPRVALAARDRGDVEPASVVARAIDVKAVECQVEEPEREGEESPSDVGEQATFAARALLIARDAQRVPLALGGPVAGTLARLSAVLPRGPPA